MLLRNCRECGKKIEIDCSPNNPQYQTVLEIFANPLCSVCEDREASIVSQIHSKMIANDLIKSPVDVEDRKLQIQHIWSAFRANPTLSLYSISKKAAETYNAR